MSESKPHPFRPPLYHGESGAADTENSAARANAAGARSRRDTRSEDKGWDAYRKWLSNVSKRDTSSRTPIDRSIYSWKGYHSWADRVKESWNSDES